MQKREYHGMSDTRLFRTWAGIKTRVTNKNRYGSNRYVGRGITMDPSWFNSFTNFYNDMIEEYNVHVEKYGERNTTIDRIDNNLGYSKQNCRWATTKVQSKNKQCSIMFEGKLARELAEANGIHWRTFYSRLSTGWELRDAIYLPTGSKNPKLKHTSQWIILPKDEIIKMRADGYTYCAIGKKYSVTDVTIRNRIKEWTNIQSDIH